MATDKQIEANRLNAQHCTGPTTEEGRARSSQNAPKTGLYSKADLLITESREAFDELIADFHTRFAPATPEERSLVDALIRYEWLSRRYMAADTAVWNHDLQNDKVPSPGRTFMRYSQTLARAGRYFGAARKGFSAALKELRALQAERKSEQASESNSEQFRSPLPSRDREEAVTQPSTPPEPSPNQTLTPKLVSFRQPQNSPLPIPPRTGSPDENQPPGELQPGDIDEAA